MAITQNFLKFFLYRFGKNNRSKTTKGFTLTELLTTVILSGIVLSALLTAMVKVLRSDQLEGDRTKVQQEMHQAIDYIAQDLKEAVYVYNDNQIKNQIKDSIPDFGNDVTPVLAFWKIEPISESDLPSSSDCSNSSLSDEQQAECNALIVKRHAYSLIVYLQSKENSTTWKGKSRILRYRLPKYSNLSDSNISNKLQHTTGFIDPGVYKNFSTWPDNLQLTRPTLSGGNSPVLVDFVDDPSSTSQNQLVCPDLDGNTATEEYARVPDLNSPINFQSNSFYACVRTTGTLGIKQDVIVYLRGNSKETGEQSNADDVKAELQTRVTTGGIIDKYGVEE
ncbi:MAG: prepilin-type N-terminal cleavage/methylation domain-containing protein [Prochloraceae cyanobacterium]|nr:prepilin-type N-terminal cleavage/methylation domain-containing protein [Prochloraceae cyanobacterium]